MNDFPSGLHSTPELVSCEIDLVTTYIFGAVSSGSIFIKGFILNIDREGLPCEMSNPHTVQNRHRGPCKGVRVSWDQPNSGYEDMYF
jgi:hypothetical protein